ncbi:MAG: hypothetical protein AAF479_00145 [Pseudomonadota bacterium]
MKSGVTISGVAHVGMIVFAIWGVDWLSGKEHEPLTIAEIELVDGTDFDAALSTAPVVQSEGPSELLPPSENADAPSEVEQPEDEQQTAEAPVLSQADDPEAQPEKPEVAFPPPPTDIPTEAPQPSIAEIPSPDSLVRQAAEPESPDATEPQRAVAAIRAPLPSARPNRPPDPEPEPELNEPEPERETATLAQTQPTPEDAPTETSVTESESPSTDPLQPLASVGAPAPTTRPERPPEPEAEPEPEQPEKAEDVARPEQVETANPKPDSEPQPEPTDTEVVEEDAPEGPAPQIAKLPVAKPADKAAAALAARKTEQAKQATQVAENKPKKSTKPKTKTGGSSAVRAPKLSRGEKSALRVGIKKYYTYGGDRSDKSLRVTIRVKLNQNGSLNGNPTQRRAKGGSAASQRAVFQAGRRAIIRAANAGEFRKLPAAKYGRWKVIDFVFTATSVGGVS